MAVQVEEREYGKKPLGEDEVLALVKAAGGVAAVLNARHETAKARGWKDSPPDAATFARAVAAEANLIRRPIVLVSGKAIVGLDEEAYRALA